MPSHLFRQAAYVAGKTERASLAAAAMRACCVSQSLRGPAEPALRRSWTAGRRLPAPLAPLPAAAHNHRPLSPTRVAQQATRLEGLRTGADAPATASAAAPRRNHRGRSTRAEAVEVDVAPSCRHSRAAVAWPCPMRSVTYAGASRHLVEVQPALAGPGGCRHEWQCRQQAGCARQLAAAGSNGLRVDARGLLPADRWSHLEPHRCQHAVLFCVPCRAVRSGAHRQRPARPRPLEPWSVGHAGARRRRRRSVQPRARGGAAAARAGAVDSYPQDFINISVVTKN